MTPNTLQCSNSNRLGLLEAISCNFVIENFDALQQNSRVFFEKALLYETRYKWMSACIFSIINKDDANAIVKNLIPNISNKGQFPLIPKGYRRPILKIKHMTGTYDPKETLKVALTDIDANISIFHVCCLAISCLIAS